MATAHILNERVPSDHDPRSPLDLASAHRPEPRLRSAVIAFDPIVLVLLGVVERGGDELVDHVRQCRCPIRDHLDRLAVRGQ